MARGIQVTSLLLHCSRRSPYRRYRGIGKPL